MSLKLHVEEEMKAAMKNKDKDRLEALRAIKSLILLAQTQEGAGTDLSEEQEMKLLMKAAKQRRESAEIYEQKARLDLAQTERKQLMVIEEFLPKMLSADEVKIKLEEIAARLGINSAKDLGKLMGVATKELAGKTDGKTISELAKQLLA